jgi:hypothetical protein
MISSAGWIALFKRRGHPFSVMGPKDCVKMACSVSLRSEGAAMLY